MARYKLLIKPSAVKEIEEISRKKDRQRIIKRIHHLGANPRPEGCRKLSGKEHYRLRQGSYRIVSSVEDDTLIVSIVRVGHRKDIYQKTL
ncbi:MAG: type II toxin-antitoxin system RelE/ParE family toxin [Acidobacteria bacterium]|nr:type II toxin-antitoxin system RelE/ParE family toxin [Acidobacteriota bacterium]